jgi:tetratricopeptide (TPR) repeat protein
VSVNTRMIKRYYHRADTPINRQCDSFTANDGHWLSRICRSGVFIGSFFVMLACLAYYHYGFNVFIFATWLIGIGVCGRHLFAQRTISQIKISRLDLLTAMALAVVSIPLYVLFSYNIPFQLNEDEIVLIYFERDWVAHGIGDIFGLSNYFGFTYFPFLLQGWLSHWLGGIDLFHLRFLNGLAGVVIVLLSFLFYRVIGLRWLMATSASLFVCYNHSLFAISRMASRTNGGLLVALLALTALFEGLKRRCPLTTYIGGLFTGLCFYTYYSARIILPVWLACLATLYFFKRSLFSFRAIVRLVVPFALGLALAGAPMATALLRQTDIAAECLDYQREQCLLYPQGRKLAMHWTGAKTIAEGVLRNIRNGLMVFNNTREDQSNFYVNLHHGFVDPLSGLLLWIGFLTVLIFLPKDLEKIFMVVGFLFEWLFFSLIVAESGNYNRLLVILPFAGYFVAYGIQTIASCVGSQIKKAGYARNAKILTFWCGNIAIMFLNLSIFYDYVRLGLEHGDDVGGTARYVLERRAQKDHLLVLAASPQFPYYDWDTPEGWTDKVEPFLGKDQDYKVWAPEDLTSVTLVPPFTIFMDGELWQLKRQELANMYSHLVLHKIRDERGLVAVEDPDIVPASRKAHALYRGWNDYPEKIDRLLNAGRNVEAEKLCLNFLRSPDAKVNGDYFRSRILLSLANVYMKLAKFKEAEPLLLEVFRICTELSGWKSERAASIAVQLGDLYAGEHKWDAAEKWYRKAAETRELVQRDCDMYWVADLTRSYRLIGESCLKQEKFAEAQKAFKRALELCRPERGEGEEKTKILKEYAECKKVDYDHLADSYARQGFERMKAGQYTDAEEAYSKAIAVKGLSEGTDNDLAQIFAKRGFVYLKMGRFIAAEKDYDAALRFCSTDCADRSSYERDRSYARDQRKLHPGK